MTRTLQKTGMAALAVLAMTGFAVPHASAQDSRSVTRTVTTNPDGSTSYDKTTRTSDPVTGTTTTQMSSTQAAAPTTTVTTTRTTEDSWYTPEQTTYTTSDGKSYTTTTTYDDANGDEDYARPAHTGTYAMGKDAQGNTTQRYENMTIHGYND